MALDEKEMIDALDYQSELWERLAKYLQGTWKSLAEGFEQFRLDATFIRDVGLAAFLPICSGVATSVLPSQANVIAASGTMNYDLKKGL
jgi:hypothetical protein